MKHLVPFRFVAFYSLAAITLCCIVPTSAQADAVEIGIDTNHTNVISFDFNSLHKNANNSSVQNYMQNQLPNGSNVWVHGAQVRTDYTGDRHAVGPVQGSSVEPVTLGTSDGGNLHSGFDSFLTNSGSDRITMEFDFPIYAISFDYQIFPDGTLPDGTNRDPSHPNWPDFSLVADGELIFQTFGVMPGTDGTFPHSPFSGPNRLELAPQFIGSSGAILFPDGVSRLEFVDWPRMIGIDNLRVATSRQSVETPEPGTLALFAVTFGSIALYRRRRRMSESGSV